MKKTPPLVAVVLCGGSGSRLWPLSRAALPKPFVALPGGGSLLGGTYRRLTAAPADGALAAVVTVCAAPHDFLCAAAFAAAGIRAPHIIIREPCARNTAAAVAAANEWALRQFGGDCVLLVLPADHHIGRTSAFWRAVAAARRAAGRGYLALLGIAPDSPSPAYGYIAPGKRLAAGVFRADRFIEKPDRKRAARYLKNGCLWNAGIFCFTPAAMEKMLARYAPATAAAVAAAIKVDDNGVSLDRRAYARAPALSLDYAVAEKTDSAAVVAAQNLEWSDAGGLAAFARLAQKPDAAGNRAPAGTMLRGCRNVSVAAAGGRLIAAAGMEDVVIADTPDALLVAAAADAAQAGEFFSVLQKRKRPTALEAPTTPRPWGAYTVLAEGRGWKVKRIEVAPGAALSLQSHARRREHWTAVEGELQVVINRRRLTLKKGQSCVIPQGAKHRLANRAAAPGAIIEVQIGDYLGEDDIVRYADIYGRV